MDSGCTPLPTIVRNGIRYFDSGPRSGLADVVLLHGLGNSLQFWVRVAPLLTRTARVIALDIPGFGKSSPPESNDLQAYTASIRRLLDGLGLHKFHIVGHSMGAAVAGALAVEVPEKVESLLLISAMPFSAFELIRRPHTAVRAPGLSLNLAYQLVGGTVPLGRGGAKLIAGSKVLRKLALWPFIHDVDHIPPEMLAAALEDNGGTGPTRAAVLARGTPFEELFAVPSVPVRVLRGDHDRLVDDRDQKMTVERYRAIDQEFIRDCGHWPLLEKPEIVADYISSYL